MKARAIAAAMLLHQAQDAHPLSTLGGGVGGGILNAALTGGMGLAAMTARCVSLSVDSPIPAMAA
jgi:outer membrane lipoprotein SlyB